MTASEPLDPVARTAPAPVSAGSRRKRRRRFVWFAHAFTALIHALSALALSALLPTWVSVLVAAVLWIGTAVRLSAIAGDRKRPRWQTLLWDLPMFWHWGGCFFGSLLFVAGGVVLMAAHLFGATSIAATSFALGSYAVGLVISAWAIGPRRRWVRVRRVEVPIAGLSTAFDGYRIALLSDLHIGSFDPRAHGERWVNLANRCDPDLAVVVGDLVTSGTDFYDDAAAVVGGLRARDGVCAVLGNHDQWDAAELTRKLQNRDVCVLDNASCVIRRHQAELALAGVADRWTCREDLEAALAGRAAGTPTVLLAHDPSSFEAVAARGVELMLSGHTHGGQIGVPFVARRLNIARLAGQRPQGLVRRATSLSYVSSGLGTTGPPLRLGVPPEVALVVLRAAAPRQGSG